MKTLRISLFSIAIGFALTLSFAVGAPDAHALACASGYPQSRNLNGLVVVKTYALLNSACEAKSTKVDSVNKGQVVKVVARASGWYQVISVNGKAGWLPRAYIKTTSKKLTNPESIVMAKSAQSTDTAPLGGQKTPSSSTITKMKGRMLIPLEDSTKAYYFDPKTSKLELLNTPELLEQYKEHAATQAARGALAKNASGELAYIHPDTGKAYRIDISQKGIDTLRSFAIQMPQEFLKTIDPSLDGSIAQTAPTAGTEQPPALPQ